MTTTEEREAPLVFFNADPSELGDFADELLEAVGGLDGVELGLDDSRSNGGG